MAKQPQPEQPIGERDQAPLCAWWWNVALVVYGFLSGVAGVGAAHLVGDTALLLLGGRTLTGAVLQVVAGCVIVVISGRHAELVMVTCRQRWWAFLARR